MVAANNSKLLLWLQILQERKKREKMNAFITYITLRRCRLRNLLFLLLQNEVCFFYCKNQSYDRIRSHHKRSCRWYLRNSGWFSNVWKTIAMKVSKLFSEFQEKHSPIYLVNSNFARRKARNLSIPPGSWRLLPNYFRAKMPWDSDSKKYYSRSIKPYCNQTLEKMCCFPKNWRRICK